ncbi:MAG TPA: CYTH domain-containing protein [Exilispira sp.]|nr:CYTH domain-containing protein [Exilispira sp.]
MIEKELKYLISKLDYLKLREYFEEYGEEKKIIYIKTYYYDTIPFTLLPDVVFRVRVNENTEQIFLSVKANIKGRLENEISSELQVAKELNYEINNLKIDKIEKQFPLSKDILKNIGLNEDVISFINEFKKDLNIRQDYLELLGINEIERLHGKILFYNMPFDLDYTKYYDIKNPEKIFEDYELEVEDESPDKFVSIVQSIFKQKEINSLGSEKKIRRLLKYLTPHDNL